MDTMDKVIVYGSLAIIWIVGFVANAMFFNALS